MLKEVIVVEGKSDTAAIRRALEADTIETGGFTLAASSWPRLPCAKLKQRIKSAALLYLLTLTEQATAYAVF